MPRTTELIWTSSNRSVIRGLEQIANQSEKTDRQLSKDSKNTSNNFDRVGKSTHRLHSAVVGLAGTVGFAGLAFGMKDVIEAGLSLQGQQAQLQAALKATGQSGTDAYKKLNEAAIQSSEHGGFKRDQEIQSITRFVRTTHDSTKALQANRIAIMLSRGAGLDYSQSQKYIQQALVGNVRRLQQYIGPIIAAKNAQFGLSQQHAKQIANLETEAQAMGRGSAAWVRYSRILQTITPQQRALAQLQDKSSTAAQAFSAIQTLYGGSVSAYNNTTQGKLSNFHNLIDETNASIGAKLLPTVNDLVSGATTLVNVITKVPAPVLAAVVGFTALGFVIRPFKDMVLLVKDGFSALRGALVADTTMVEENAAAVETNTGKLALFGGGLKGVLGKLGMLSLAIAALPVVAHAVKDQVKLDSNAIKNRPGARSRLLQHTFQQQQHGGTGFQIPIHPGSIIKSIGGFFGLHEGGVVQPPRYFASGGPTGPDTIPGWLTPGEGVVNTRGMGMLGERGLSMLNHGGNPFASGAHFLTPVIVKLDRRVLTKAVVQQVLNDAARGPSSLVGGSLVTGAPGLPA